MNSRTILSAGLTFLAIWPVCHAQTDLEEPELRPTRIRLASESADSLTRPGIVRLEIDAAAYRRLWTRGQAVVEGFPLPGRHPVDLQLSSFSVLAPDARSIVVDAEGEREVAPPSMRFFRGIVADDVNSTVTLSLFEGRIAGFVRAWGEEFGFGPADYDLAKPGAKDVRVWNRRLTETETRSCDMAAQTPATSAFSPAGAGGGAARGIDSGTQLKAQIAVDATVEWFDHFGSLGAAQSYILNLMAQVSTIYDTEILVQIEVPYLRVHTAEPDPYTDGSISTTLLLDEMQAEWNATQSGIFRTAAHLFSVKASGGSGRAYVDVLCDNVVDPGDSADYGVSVISALGQSFEKELVAHELGHNFSSPHTHCYTPEIDRCSVETGCYPGPEEESVSTIMSYCSDTIAEFHPRVEDEKIRPAAEAAFGVCVDTAGLPGDLRTATGDGLMLSRPRNCPSETLQADDGSVNTNFGATGTAQLAWIKRFTPGCYPFRLTDVRVIIGHSSVEVGRPIRVVVYTEPGGSGNPADATLVHHEDVAVQVVNYGVFNEYALSVPVTLNSGDFYLGFYDLEADATTTFIAAADTASSGDSYRAFNSTSPDGFGAYTGATWMVRGDGGPVPAGSVLLEWRAPCNDPTVPGQDFGVYLGAIETYDEYSSLTCSTTREREYLAEAPPDGSFFLVVPQTTAAEGSYGRTSESVERSPATIACKPHDPAACP